MTDDYKCKMELLNALDWQRSNADIIKQFIQNEQNWIDENHCKFWEDWQVDVFSLDTANDFGLSVWSIILNEPVYGYFAESPQDYPSWGFGVDDENFNDGSFASATGVSYEFTTAQKRIILKLKAFQVLAMSGPIEQTNVALANMFGPGVMLAFDGLNMTYSYQLSDTTISGFVSELLARDLLPRPIGINIIDVRFLETDTWGFAETDENFFDGNFYDGTI